MKLGEPAIEFRSVQRALYARSTSDLRWYKVKGITRTLDSIARPAKRTCACNMISMGLFRRAVEDLNSDPDGSLEWVADYAKHLNAPEHKCAELKAALSCVFGSNGAPSLSACRRAWDKTGMSRFIGATIDAECKDVFNGRKSKSQVGPVSRLILTQLEALRLTPVRAGLKVAGIPKPDAASRESGRYTYHNECSRGCRGLGDGWGFYTEVDLVAHDPVTDTVALLELKTRNNDVLDPASLWRYNAQLWLTWLMFSLTYPSLAERSAAYLVIIRPGTNEVKIRRCMRPAVSKTMRSRFPWLTCFCSQVLNCLAPTCVNMRVETRLAAAHAKDAGTEMDPSDLCYRNMLFNEEKKQKQKQQQKKNNPTATQI